MAAEENKVLVRRYIEEALNKGNMAVLDEVIAPDAVDHSAPPDQQPGIAGTREFVKILRAEWPDLQFTIEDQLAEGDKVTTRWTVRGTHTQPVGSRLGTVAPSQNKVQAEGITIDRISGGKIAETWYRYDEASLLQQMGAVPQMASAAR